MANQGKRGYFGILPTLLLSDNLSSLEQKILAILSSLPEDLAGWPPAAYTNVQRIAKAFHSKRRTVRKALSSLKERGWIHVERISWKRIRISLTQKFLDEIMQASPPPIYLDIFDFEKPAKEEKPKPKPTPQYFETRERIEAILSKSFAQKQNPIDISKIPEHVLEAVYESYSVHVEDYQRTSPDWLYWELKKAIAELEKSEK